MDARLAHLKNLTDETVLTTPKPWACSTVEKKKVVKNLHLNKISSQYEPDSSTESLGLLSLQSDDLQFDKEQKTEKNLHEKLKHERSLAQDVLRKSIKDGDLPSRYLHPSDATKHTSRMSTISSNSTISESDLFKAPPLRRSLKGKSMSNVSTPRSSEAYDSLKSKELDLSNIGRISQQMSYFEQALGNSNLSFAEICKQFDGMNLSSAESDRDSFTPGELAVEQLAADEAAWRNKRDDLAGNQLVDSVANASNALINNEQMSEFFIKKSNLSSSFLADSPERDDMPVPLIEPSINNSQLLSSVLDQGKATLSITDIAKLLASGNDTKNIIDKFLLNTANAASENQVSSTETKQQDSDTFEFLQPQPPLTSTLKDYTSDESIEIVDSKTGTLHEKTFSTQRSASSLDTLLEGKLPIESTRSELVWGCVKLGKHSTQEFVLRNKSHSKLRMQMSISGNSFKVLKDRPDSEPVSDLTIVLHSFESRTFYIIFTPVVLGAAIERLNFYPVNKELRKRQKPQIVKLFGYGGHAQVEIQNITKDTTGKFWLSLGHLQDNHQVQQSFVVKNTGTLTAFGCLTVTTKGFYGLTKIKLSHSAFVLKPKEQLQISASYEPGKDDIKHLMRNASEVVEIGAMQIISGAEALRARIRRLCRKIREESGLPPDPIIERLSDRIPNEKPVADTGRFKETIGSTKILMQTLISREIVVTLEQDSESTLTAHIAGIDESSMFQSLCQDNFQSTIVDTTLKCNEPCIIEPLNLILTPPYKVSDSILMISKSQSPMQYQVNATPEGLLDVNPRAGIITPEEHLLLNVNVNATKIRQAIQMAKLSISVESDVFEVEIKIVPIKLSK